MTAGELRVAIVDDTPDLRLLLRVVIESQPDFVVGEAGDGAQGVEVVWTGLGRGLGQRVRRRRQGRLVRRRPPLTGLRHLRIRLVRQSQPETDV